MCILVSMDRLRVVAYGWHSCFLYVCFNLFVFFFGFVAAKVLGFCHDHAALVIPRRFLSCKLALKMDSAFPGFFSPATVDNRLIDSWCGTLTSLDYHLTVTAGF